MVSQSPRENKLLFLKGLTNLFSIMVRMQLHVRKLWKATRVYKQYKIRANFLTHSISHYSECRPQWSCAMYFPDRKGWNENCGNHICWPKFLRCFWDLKTAKLVQLQACNLSEFFSVQEKEAGSNEFSSLEGGF